MLLIRADANVSIATGHVMRCLALAQAWRASGGEVLFAMAESTPALRSRLGEEKFEIAAIDAVAGSLDDADQTARLAAKHGATCAVIDGYHFDSKYQHCLKDAAVRFLLMDDTGRSHHLVADYVLNQNPYASEELYPSHEPYTQLLLGSRYAILRRDFLARKGWERTIPATGTRLLVTLGGSDPDNVTLRVLEALPNVHVEGLDVVVIVGGSNPHFTSLQDAATRSVHPIRVLKDVADLSEWMVWADACVSAAGATCWELCLLGLPAVLLDLAPNQLRIAQKLDELGVGVYLGSGHEAASSTISAGLESVLLSAERRRDMSRKGRQLVDGNGVSRVVNILRHSESARAAG